MGKRKIAALLALIIGALAIFAGGQVIFLGKVMDYYVIDWLPIYNFIIGIISVFVSSVLIWKGATTAQKIAMFTLGIHAAVMLILQIFYKEVVAPDSVRAMTVRIVAWVIILFLIRQSSQDTKQTVRQ